MRTNQDAMDILLALYAGQETDATLDELLHPDVECRDWTMPGRIFRGPAEVLNECFLPGTAAFADDSESVIEVIRDANGLFLRATFSARFVGHYRGVAPHGEPLTYEVVDSYQFRDGQIVSMRFGADTLAAAIALGVVSAADAPW